MQKNKPKTTRRYVNVLYIEYLRVWRTKQSELFWISLGNTLCAPYKYLFFSKKKNIYNLYNIYMEAVNIYR